MPYHLSSFGPGDYGHSTSSYIPPPLPLPDDRHLVANLYLMEKKKQKTNPALILPSSQPPSPLPLSLPK